MSKRILALLLCAIMVVSLFVGCGKKNEADKGPFITMYLSDDIYDFDPIKAFYNAEARNVVSLMFDTLFALDEDGKVQKSLAKSYSTDYNEETGEHTMEIKLAKTYWSNGSALTADDVVYAWRRLLRCDSSSTAAALLYDIKNARLIKEGGGENIYVDELGVEALETDLLLITFEGKPDYDQFLLNLTSIATAPLLEDCVAKNDDWAKKGSTMITSGPFKLGKISYVETDGYETDINGTDQDGKPLTEEQDFNTMKIENFYLERNSYYKRNAEKDAIDKSVTPYRLLVDCSKTDAELLQDYKDGKLFYMGSIPMSIRGDEFVKANAEVSDALSTVVCYINQDALINGNPLFADAGVRRALSLAIDREAIAKQVVFAKAATALVPGGVFNTDRKSDFRTEGGNLLATTANIDAAKAAIPAGTNPSDYSFTIKVAATNDVHVAIAESVAAAWGTNGLGFNVTVEKIDPIVNNDYFKEYGTIPEDLCDDLFVEDIEQKDFEVAIFDYVAYSADAYSMLANFAHPFSGFAVDPNTFATASNSSGYNSQKYNDYIEAAYLLPYFSTLSETSTDFLGIYVGKEAEYTAMYNRVKAVYSECGITPTDDEDDWAEQRATILHKAEATLMEEMAVIPVVFNQHAVLKCEALDADNDNYYTPISFTKATVKDFEKYTYEEPKKDAEGNDRVDADGKPVIEFKTIFDNFPIIEWDKKQ